MIESWGRKQKLIDIDEKITNFLKQQIRRADGAEKIDWYKFRKYCIEFGVNDLNILTIPITTLDRLIKRARKELSK